MTDVASKLTAFALVIFLCVASLPAGARAAAREETVEARGTAQISGRRDVAREQALSDALRHAVRQAVGVMVESETLVRNEMLVTDQVLSRSNGFIRKYSVLSESEKDGTYTVDVQAVVSGVRLKRALDAIGVTARKMGKPRIMLVVSDSGAGKAASGVSAAPWGRGVVETRIHDLLIGKGFDFVDRKAAVPGQGGTEAAGENGASALTAEALSKVAKAGAAQIVFAVSADSRSASSTIPGTSMHPCQATVSVKAINTDNGEVIASHAAQAAAPHINPATGEAEALGKAAEQVAEALSRQILANWKGKVEGTRTVRLVVSGLGGYDDLKSLKDTLNEEIEEIEEIWERSFEGKTANIDLEIAASPRSLADELSSLSVRGKPVKITSFTTNVVNLTLGPQKGAAK